MSDIQVGTVQIVLTTQHLTYSLNTSFGFYSDSFTLDSVPFVSAFTSLQTQRQLFQSITWITKLLVDVEYSDKPCMQFHTCFDNLSTFECHCDKDLSSKTVFPPQPPLPTQQECSSV